MSSGMSDAAKNIGGKSEEFAVGDWVYELCSTINLVELTASGRAGQPLRTISRLYLPDGRCTDSHKHPGIFKATSEIRQALVALYGEDAVLRLPLRGSELVKKLLEVQKYVLCKVSDCSEKVARKKGFILTIVTDFNNGAFVAMDGARWHCAIPVDLVTGEEITDLPSPADDSCKQEPDLEVDDILRCSHPHGPWFQAGARYIVKETDEGLAMIDIDGDAWNYKEMRGRHFVFGHGDTAQVAFEKD